MAMIDIVAQDRSGPAAEAVETGGAQGLTMRLADAAAWDAAIAGFDGVVHEQLVAFAGRRWPALRLDPVLFSRAGAVVGGALIMVRRLPLGLGALAVSKWGPMLADAGRHDADALYGAMLDALAARYADRQGMVLSVMPRPLDERGARQHAMLAARGFRPAGQMAHPDRYIVTLGLSEAAQRKSLGQKWRYHLNKSEKAGLEFIEAGPERLDEFDRLYRAMSDRKRFPDYSAYETVPALFAGAEAARPRLFFVSHEGCIVAGAVIFTAGARAEYLYGATSDEALPLRAGYFMHWQIVRWLAGNSRARCYDLGGTEGFQGLHQFKKGLAGDAGVIAPIPPTMTYASRLRARAVGRAAFMGRELVHAARHRLARRETAKPAAAARPAR